MNLSKLLIFTALCGGLATYWHHYRRQRPTLKMPIKHTK
jgi:hypothetical protein